MKASDIYGAVGVPNTQDETRPTQPVTDSTKANNVAKGKWKLGNGYGTIVMLLIIGSLFAAKFYLEK